MLDPRDPSAINDAMYALHGAMPCRNSSSDMSHGSRAPLMLSAIVEEAVESSAEAAGPSSGQRADRVSSQVDRMPSHTDRVSSHAAVYHSFSSSVPSAGSSYYAPASRLHLSLAANAWDVREASERAPISTSTIDSASMVASSVVASSVSEQLGADAVAARLSGSPQAPCAMRAPAATRASAARVPRWDIHLRGSLGERFGTAAANFGTAAAGFGTAAAGSSSLQVPSAAGQAGFGTAAAKFGTAAAAPSPLRVPSAAGQRAGRSAAGTRSTSAAGTASSRHASTLADHRALLDAMDAGPVAPVDQTVQLPGVQVVRGPCAGNLSSAAGSDRPAGDHSECAAPVNINARKALPPARPQVVRRTGRQEIQPASPEIQPASDVAQSQSEGEIEAAVLQAMHGGLSTGGGADSSHAQAPGASAAPRRFRSLREKLSMLRTGAQDNAARAAARQLPSSAQAAARSDRAYQLGDMPSCSGMRAYNSAGGWSGARHEFVCRPGFCVILDDKSNGF